MSRPLLNITDRSKRWLGDPSTDIKARTIKCKHQQEERNRLCRVQNRGTPRPRSKEIVRHSNRRNECDQERSTRWRLHLIVRGVRLAPSKQEDGDYEGVNQVKLVWILPR